MAPESRGTRAAGKLDTHGGFRHRDGPVRRKKGKLSWLGEGEGGLGAERDWRELPARLGPSVTLRRERNTLK